MNLRLPCISLIGLALGSCAILGINPKHKTPRKAGTYPKFTARDSTQGSYHELRSNNDVYHYELWLDIDPEKKYLQGRVTMSVLALENVYEMQVDLFENMQVKGITCSEGPVKYHRDNRAIIVQFEGFIPEGNRFKLTVDYEGKPVKAPRPPWNGGFVWKKDGDKAPFVGVACELKGPSLWWPVKDHLRDEPDSVDLHFSVPEGLFCVSNGQLRGQHTAGGKTQFDWHVSYPINNYNVTVYAGNYTHFSIPYEGLRDTFDLDFYVLPEHLDKAREQFRQAPLALHAYEEYFGPYPWPRDGYKLVESPYAGMEHQSAIAYGAKFRNAGFGSYDYIIVHETAHEWWGNSVSAPDFSEVWIHEGFATYAEALMEEKYEGHDAYLQYVHLISVFIKNKRPVVGPKDVKFWDYHDNDLYMKGAAFLHTLRTVLNNDDLFFDLLQTFYQNHRMGFATTEDFRALVNEKTGKDYGYLFDQYLYSRVCPELEYAFFYNPYTDRDELVYRWTNTGPDFKMPVYLGKKGARVTIVPTPETQVLAPQWNSLLINPEGAYIRVTENDRLRKQRLRKSKEG